MKLTVFPSGHGDCLLLESAGERMLIDGGLKGSFRESVLPVLSGTTLDCVYLSHVDADHIGGLLELVDTTFDWRVHEYKKSKDPDAKPPKSPQPPEILKVWHNSFSDVLKEAAKPLAQASELAAEVLAHAEIDDPRLDALRAYHENLAETVRQSLELRFRLSPDQLSIPVNPEHQGKLMYVPDNDDPQPLSLGNAQITILGPSETDLENKRQAWVQWMNDEQEVLKAIRKQAKADAGQLVNTAEGVLAPQIEVANGLFSELLAQQLPGLDPKEVANLGNRGAVTVWNLASLMFLVEENGETILLTGDGHADDVNNGLERAGKLDAQGNFHVDILKVQHHGSEKNMTHDFAKRITADHYVFCGNGHSDNPSRTVFDTIFEGRKKSKKKGKYKFWFNTAANANAHMKIVAKDMKTLAKASDRLSFSFHGDPFDVE